MLSLERLVSDPDFKVVLAVTQPDKPVGRAQALQASPVKRAAERLGLEVFQPISLRKDASVAERLRGLSADAFVVASYGKILPKEILDIPPKGCLNVHGSLLPRWRGASPVQAAISAGDKTTGVTVMLMDVGLDTGPVLAKTEVVIDDADTTDSLMTKLAKAGAELLVPTLKLHCDGHTNAVPQPEDGFTVTTILKKDDGRIDWKKDAEAIERHVRAMTPWPGAWASFTRDGKTFKLAVRKSSVLNPTAACGSDATPGLVCKTTSGFGVNCGKGSLNLETVQLEGKSETDGKSFLNGHPDTVGSRLG